MARKRSHKRQSAQTAMKFRTWGGRREGAGRPKKSGRGRVPHRERPKLASRFPVHVTYRMAGDVRSLRNFKLCRELRNAFARANADGFRVCQFSVQGNHIHMIVEAKSANVLARRLRAFANSVTKRLNGLLGRRGSAFADRYHAEPLKSPRQVRNTLCYVLQNSRRHAPRVDGWIDPFSSWRYFDGWREPPAETRPPIGGPAPVRPPHTWLLRVGWRRHGLIGVNEVPAAGRPRGRGAAA